MTRGRGAFKVRQIKDRARVEMLLPAHLLELALGLCSKAGYEFRGDIPIMLNRSMAVAFQNIDAMSVRRVAKMCDEAANALLDVLNADTAPEALLAVAMFNAKLIDEHLHPDPRNQGILASLLLLDDAKADEGELWGVKERQLLGKVGSMLTRIRMLGYYQVVDPLLSPLSPEQTKKSLQAQGYVAPDPSLATR